MKYEAIFGILIVLAIIGVFTPSVMNNSSLNKVISTRTNMSIETITDHMLTKANINHVLSQQEVNNILFMREEEKLARDVYLTFYNIYGLQIFQNIARSEQNHMDAVQTLIEKYGLTDPVIDEIGVFTNKTLQELYSQLIEQGSRSLADALRVGALIEEKDIVDINKLLGVTKNQDVIQVFSNLVNGSMRHLVAFATEYEKVLGEHYQPQLLPLEQYKAIISSVTKGFSNVREQMRGES